jgi:hypothetical protein
MRAATIHPDQKGRVLMLAGEASSGMDPAAFESLRERYEYDSWRQVEPDRERLQVWRFFLSEVAFPGWRPERIQTVAPHAPWPRSLQSIWSQEERDGVLSSIFVSECPSTAAARVLLLQTLGEFQAVLERQPGPGDVTFGLANETVLLMGVANLVLIVRNAGPEVASMRNLAAELERHLAGRPEPGGKVVPEIQIFAGAELRPGAALAPLVLEASDPLDRPLWFKLFSRSGEVQQERDRLVFRPDGAGPHEITAYALNENGGVATRRLVLSG